MPARSRFIKGEYTVRVTKRIEAPASYAYQWLTDFRHDDGRFAESRPKYEVLRLTKDRTVRIRTAKGHRGSKRFALELIRLEPPDRWHVDQIDEEDLAAVDYRVRRLGPRRCRVTLDITERWMVRPYPSAADYQKSTGGYWDTIVAGLEADYRAGKRPR